MEKSKILAENRAVRGTMGINGSDVWLSDQQLLSTLCRVLSLTGETRGIDKKPSLGNSQSSGQDGTHT